MKIFGIGTDIVNINRVKKSLKRGGSNFKNKIFSKNEILYCEKKINPSSFYAKRFAAKEALSKALGVGIRKGISPKNIEVINNNSIQGWRHSSNWAADQRLFFYIQLSEDISEVVYMEDSLVAGFKLGKIENPLLVKVGISAVSTENAKENLETEISDLNILLSV